MAAAAEVRPYQNVTLSEWEETIVATGDKRVILGYGETGIGKTTTFYKIAKRLEKTHIPCYICVPHLALGDLLMPEMFTAENGMRMCRFIPNSMIRLDLGKPLLIFWDEVGKSTERGVLNQVLDAWQERRLGEYFFAEGTIQMAASNLPEEGYGDFLSQYQKNRVRQMWIRKPNEEEWVRDYAINAGVHPTIIQTVREFPQMLASFMDYSTPGTNPYINDPRQPPDRFTTPRSLKSASDFLHDGGHLPYHVKVHAIAGDCGMRAAMDIMSIDSTYSQLERWEDVMKNPEKAKVPDSAGAKCLFVYQAIQRMEEGDIGKLMIYLKRFTKETQALFATTAVNTHKSTMVTSNKAFFEWADENHWLHDENS